MWNRELLYVLNDTKLILNDQEGLQTNLGSIWYHSHNLWRFSILQTRNLLSTWTDSILIWYYTNRWRDSYHLSKPNTHITFQFLKVRIGDEVAIPLLLADEKEALVESLVQKANNIASLKADLIGDLSGLVSGLNNSPKWKGIKE